LRRDFLAIKSVLSLHVCLTVGPGSVAVTLTTLSAQANSLQFPDRIGAFLRLFRFVVFLSLLVFIFYAYAPFAAEKVPSPIANGVLRIIAFLLICIGVQSHGMDCAPCLLRHVPDSFTHERPSVCKKHGIE
jgi:multiple antibiotic resistance protein